MTGSTKMLFGEKKQSEFKDLMAWDSRQAANARTKQTDMPTSI